MCAIVSNVQPDGWLPEQSCETCVRPLVSLLWGRWEEFGALGQMDESDADNESESIRGCEVSRTSHWGNSMGEPQTPWGQGLIQSLKMEH